MQERCTHIGPCEAYVLQLEPYCHAHTQPANPRKCRLTEVLLFDRRSVVFSVFPSNLERVHVAVKKL